MQKVAPKYNVKGRTYFTDVVTKDIYETMVLVKQLISKLDFMSFTFDIWSDPSSGASLLSLTCHSLAENFARLSIILKCETFDNCHAFDIIADKFETMLTDWNISKEQVHCIIRDEGVNMKRPKRLSELNDMD